MIRISSMTDSEDPESVKGSGFAISTSNLKGGKTHKGRKCGIWNEREGLLSK